MQSRLFTANEPPPCCFSVVSLLPFTAYIPGVRHHTEANYNFVANIIKKEAFGTKRIDKVKLSDAKGWLIKQQAGQGYSTIHTVRGLVRPAFQMAVEDDLIRKNPFGFRLATVVVNDSVTREAITRKQERNLGEFIKNDKHLSKYDEGIYILLKTGLRIFEFTGLTMADVDLEKGIINVNRQLLKRYTNNENMRCCKNALNTRKNEDIRSNKNMIKILFVCHGNICRSPMAEFVMKDLIQKAGLDQEFEVASAATSTEEIGNPVHPGTRNKLKQYGISTAGKYAVQLQKADYEKYDYIVGMDSQNIRNMLRILKGDPQGKVCRLLDFGTGSRDIADPWYTGDFDKTYADVLEGCRGMLSMLKGHAAFNK